MKAKSGCGPQPYKKLKPNSTEPGGTSNAFFKEDHEENRSDEVLVSNNSLICLERLSTNDINEPVDEPEIKIERIDEVDKAKDPLHINETVSVNPSENILGVLQKGITSTGNSNNVVTTVLQTSYSKKDVRRPIILRKVVIPSGKLLKRINHNNVKSIRLNINESLSGEPSTSKISTRPIQQVTFENNPTKIATTAGQAKNVDVVNKNIDTNDAFTSETIIAKNCGDKPENKKENVCKLTSCSGKRSLYFKVPNEERKIKIWRFCLRVEKLKSGDLICDEHFIEEDILTKPKIMSNGPNIGKLKEYVVPSLKKVLRGCCIPHCINQTVNTADMYPIPIWGSYSPWLSCMGELKFRIGQIHDLQQYRVCRRHFRENSSDRLFDRVPTLHLPSKKWHEERLQNYIKNIDPGKKTSDTIDLTETKIRGSVSSSAETATSYLRFKEDCCIYLGCSLNKYATCFKFYKFPTDYDRAVKWLDACNRSDILQLSRNQIQKFITNSVGVCFRHKSTLEQSICRKETNSVNENLKNEAARFTLKLGQARIVEKSGESEKEIPIIAEIEHNTQIEIEDPSGKKTYVPTREYCAFINCSTYTKDLVKKYRFPADPDLLVQWTEAAGIPKKLPEALLRVLFVCGKHFNKNQYTALGTLIFSSVPVSHTEFVDSVSHEGNEHWVIKQKTTQKVYVPEKELPKPNQACNSGMSVCNSGIVVSNSGTAVFKSGSAVSYKQMFPRPPQAASTALIRNFVISEPITLETECIVKHCLSNIGTHTLYPFPQGAMDPTRFFHWIKAVENKAAINMSHVEKYTHKKICDRHFEKRYQIGSNLLRNDAIPTLDLVEEVIEKEKDMNIVWTECESNPYDAAHPDPKAPHIKGNCVLREQSIEFPNMGRELRFGKDCPKYGRNKFPYKLLRMTRKVYGREVECVNPGHKLQVHTAIVVDDDDESEKEAISVISRIIKKNAEVIPRRPSRRKTILRRDLVM